MIFPNIFTRTVKQEHFLFANTIAELEAIQAKELNIAIHQRKPFEALKASVYQLLNSSFKGFDFLFDVNNDIKQQVYLKLSALCESDIYELALEPLVADIEQLVFLFGNICKTDYLKLYLKIVSNDACRKFHVDGYDLRLLCTYAGQGTEWTYNDNVNRKHLGEGENEQIIKDWGYINKLNPFDVAILKGEIPNRRTGKGIVHRSPPIEERGERRLLLRIDF
jgi:hypothetical protein